MGVAIITTSQTNDHRWVIQQSGKVSWARIAQKVGLRSQWSDDVVFRAVGTTADAVLPDVVHGALFPVVSPVYGRSSAIGASTGR